LLEYDDARSGSFEALREAPEDKTIVLGLATTKSPPLESAHDLQARIHEAERYAPLERLALSPQCGFSTSIVGNRISIEEEQRKLVRIVEVAQAVWGSV
jgi:5-methyltetrahydropteroyltriglutamate--homocysteine methyltransferase